jgi:hypothetical protein
MQRVKTKRRVEEYKKHGLKNPRCMRIYPQTLGKLDQNAASQQGTVVSASERRGGAR